MRFAVVATLGLSLVAGLAVAQVPQTMPPPAAGGAHPEAGQLRDNKDKISYIVGLSIGNNLKEDGMEVSQDALLRGLKDALSGSQPLLTEAEIEQVAADFEKQMMAEAEKKQAEAVARMGQMLVKNKQDTAAFMANNKNQPGVVQTASGLQYQVLNQGNGATPKATDSVTTHYHGTLADGTVFDSSYERGQPATFPVNRVIRGWTEVLQLMKVGDKWRVWIPSEMAYGDQGQGRIPPGAMLVFDIELLNTAPGNAAPQ